MSPFNVDINKYFYGNLQYFPKNNQRKQALFYSFKNLFKISFISSVLERSLDSRICFCIQTV